MCRKKVGFLENYKDMMKNIIRMRINQPSSLQEDHKLHGRRVIADLDSEIKGCVTIYFTEGNILSMRISKLALSKCLLNG